MNEKLADGVIGAFESRYGESHAPMADVIDWMMTFGLPVWVGRGWPKDPNGSMKRAVALLLREMWIDGRLVRNKWACSPKDHIGVHGGVLYIPAHWPEAKDQSWSTYKRGDV
jgi:hypothetical protein